MRRKNQLTLAFALLVSAVGCGHTEQEWQWQLDKLTRAQADAAGAQGKISQASMEVDSEHKRVADLTRALEDAGLRLPESGAASGGPVSPALVDRERAILEFRARAKALEAMKARFDLLQKKLEDVQKVGVVVRVHRNRITISLPADELFESQKTDALKKDSAKILQKVALVIRGEGSLAGRDYLVVGHTDDRKISGGSYKDNWGVSLMRAREIMVDLVAAGQLPQEHWSASGMADQDPVAPNDSDANKQKNRRCDVVLVPTAEEVLDLRTLGGEPPAPLQKAGSPPP